MTDRLAFHRHSSWGRTRRPKNLNGNSSTSAIALESTDGSAPTAVTDGYSTENQRFLHLRILDNSAADADTTITVYAWHHAFGAWSVLQIPVGVKNGGDTTANLAYVSAVFAATSTAIARVIDIEGIDRIAFVANNTDTVVVHAACSTF